MEEFLKNTYDLQWKDAIQKAITELKQDDMKQLLDEKKDSTRNGYLGLIAG